ncbi:MAG TPA: class I SAM-dependent methyltransferase [Candidatus Hydrogenedentes bacterium]|nr:class I SAM-dependent methyltransferase [Candidatus Hydrogenedentota bacterium]
MEVEHFGPNYFTSVYKDYQRQNPEKKLAFYRALAKKALAGIGNPNILDLGCAFGHFIGSLDTVGKKFAMDASAYAIEHLKAAHPEVQAVMGELPSISFAEQFDLITAFDVLEHVNDLDAALKEIWGHLAPGGHFVFIVPVYDGPTGPIIRLLDHDPTHVHKMSRRFWLEECAPYFHVKEWQGIFRYLLPGGWYMHWPTRAFRRISPAIAVVAEKKPETTDEHRQTPTLRKFSK